MTRPSDIPTEIWERADILRDQFRDVADDTEFAARILMAEQASSVPAKVGGLTAHQRDALAFIKGYIARTGAGPSIDDVREHFGHVSKSGAHRVVCELKERGFITAMRNRPRSISIVVRG